MNFNQLHELRRDILTLDFLFDEYTRKKHSYPYTDGGAREFAAFEALKNKIVNRYGFGLFEARQKLFAFSFQHSRFNDDWTFYGRTVSNLFVWKMNQKIDGKDKEVFQATPNNLPPRNDAGFFLLDSLLKYKNTRMVAVSGGYHG